MAAFLPWFPLEFEAFKEGTRGWTAEERWTYLELLWEQWDHGGIPDDETRLHLFTEGLTRTRFLRMWRERIGAKFVAGKPGQLVNERMAVEREREEVKVAKARTAGRLRHNRPGAAVAGADAGETAAENPASAGAALAETGDKIQRPLDTDHKDTSSYIGKTTSAGARNMAVPDMWGIGAFEMLWRNVLKKAPADRYAKGITDAAGRSRDRWRELVSRIEIDAGLLEPPQTPAAYAEALMRALPAYIAHAAQHGETVPSISVAAFEGWYDTLAAWVAKGGPAANRQPAASASREIRPGWTEADEAARVARRADIAQARANAVTPPPEEAKRELHNWEFIREEKCWRRKADAPPVSA